MGSSISQSGKKTWWKWEFYRITENPLVKCDREHNYMQQLSESSKQIYEKVLVGRLSRRCVICENSWLSPSIQAILHGYQSHRFSQSVCCFISGCNHSTPPHAFPRPFHGRSKALFGKQQEQKLIESRETTPDKSRAGKWKTQNDIPQNADSKKIGNIFVIPWTARGDLTIDSITRSRGVNR